MEKIQERFVENVVRLRKGLGLSQTAVAGLCNVSGGTIGNIESGKNKPSFDLIVNLARALEVDPYKLFLDPHKDIVNSMAKGQIKSNVDSLKVRVKELTEIIEELEALYKRLS